MDFCTTKYIDNKYMSVSLENRPEEKIAGIYLPSYSRRKYDMRTLLPGGGGGQGLVDMRERLVHLLVLHSKNC
jgi:hypothetical protein